MGRFSNWAALLLRTIAGIGFAVHGWAKISRGTSGFVKLLTQLEVPWPTVLGVVVPYIELLGGIAVIIGLFARAVSFSLIGVMLVAMFTIHIHYGFSAIKTIGLTADGPLFGPPGYEINLLYIAILASIIVNSPGHFSVDHLIRRARRRAGIA